jgi:alpha-ketoglutarate-dependent taurine dioxygenase
MDAFQAYQADIYAPGWQPRIVAQLRDRGLVTLSGITSRDGLADVARRLMTIRPHRDAGPDGITVITSTQVQGPGYAAFTDAELFPHTDGSSVADSPGLLLLTCQQPAGEGGATLLADGACVISTLAKEYPAALRALSAPRAAVFGTAGGYLGAILEPAGPGRTRIRLRLDELAWFSADAAGAVSLLRTVIARHVLTVRLHAGEGVLLSNTRWLHGRDRYSGRRTMLRVLGDSLPGTGIVPGFPSPSLETGTRTPRAA